MRLAFFGLCFWIRKLNTTNVPFTKEYEIKHHTSLHRLILYRVHSTDAFNRYFFLEKDDHFFHHIELMAFYGC